jgi:glycosyltransferase involved in cell wall biosynthesis
MKRSVFLIMPAYNVERQIAATVAKIPHGVCKKLIIVNDGSRDGTLAVAKKIKSRDFKIQIINHPRNLGYAMAQKHGYAAALKQGADAMVLLHGDGQYDPALIPLLLKPLLAGQADVVQGSRMLGDPLKGGMPLYKFLGNKFLTLFENTLLGLDISEFHSGFIVYSRKALTRIPFEQMENCFHFDGEMIITAHEKGLKVKEVAIPTRYAGETSNLNAFTYGLRVIKIALKHRFKRRKQ